MVTCRWLATLCLVNPSTLISSRILEGMAWSIPSCSTAWTNRLCKSGVQSTCSEKETANCSVDFSSFLRFGDCFLRKN